MIQSNSLKPVLTDKLLNVSYMSLFQSVCFETLHCCYCSNGLISKFAVAGNKNAPLKSTYPHNCYHYPFYIHHCIGTGSCLASLYRRSWRSKVCIPCIHLYLCVKTKVIWLLQKNYLKCFS